MQVTQESSVDEIIAHVPRAAHAFIRRRMHCVGCPLARFETLRDACLVYRQPLDAMLTEIRVLATEPPEPAESI
ncbi:MAG TPA: DUF1858 domain-containing protein [Thermomicrobiaceae bacterium]|nr:DUF1858 domain-containing protein [Thermomicrobiaceae bacterium]